MDSLKDGSALGIALVKAADQLPERWSLSFEVEHGYGGVILTTPHGDLLSADDYGSVDSTAAENVDEAILWALAHDAEFVDG